MATGILRRGLSSRRKFIGHPLSVVFLGTGAGLSPTISRACSATLLSIGGSTCLIDAAEGTHLQLLKLKSRLNTRLRDAGFKEDVADLPVSPNDDIDKIFVTHLHMDHCMGLPVLLREMLSRERAQKEPLEIFGPVGLRQLIRSVFALTSSAILSDEKYCVHELMHPNDVSRATPCDTQLLNANEIPGRDLVCETDGTWPRFLSTDTFEVSAASIAHRVFCLGYVFSERRNEAAAHPAGAEPPQPADEVLPNSDWPSASPAYPRKVAILGDTSNPRGISSLAQNADLLVHEATLTHLPLSIGPGAKKSGSFKGTPEEVEAKAISKGHSTPSMAGAFAKDIGAKALALNHFSARYPDLRYGGYPAVMQEIERQASAAWGLGKARATRDFSSIQFPFDGKPIWKDI